MVTVHVQLAQNGESHAVVDLAESLDLIVGTGILTAELVAREAEDEEVLGMLGFDGLVEGFKALELRGEAAFRGSVDDKDDFALQRGKGEGLSLFCLTVG